MFLGSWSDGGGGKGYHCCSC